MCPTVQATFLLTGFFVDRNQPSVSQSATQAQSIVGAPTMLGRALAPLVLIADGAAASREIREGQLRSVGLRVSVARTGFEAIVKACCQVPDIILVDDSVAGIDATETIQMLTTCPMTAHIPIVRLLRGRRLPQRMLSRLRRVAA